MDGWIKIHRKIIENPLYFSEPFTKMQAWIDLLLLANCKDGFFYVRGNKVTVQRGQIGTSSRSLAVRWKWSRCKVERFLNDLKNSNQIEPQKSNIITLISICNFDEYQNIEPQKSHRKATEKPQKSLNNKNKEEYNNILPIGSALPIGNATLNSKARESFESHYKETFGNDYYWTAKDAGAMTQLLKKLKFQRSQKKLDNTDDEVISALVVFLKSIDSGWIFENFSVTKINSQFNEILTQIYNKKNGKAIKNSSSRNEQKSRESDERKECVANLVKKLREQDLADM